MATVSAKSHQLFILNHTNFTLSHHRFRKACTAKDKAVAAVANNREAAVDFIAVCGF